MKNAWSMFAAACAVFSAALPTAAAANEAAFAEVEDSSGLYAGVNAAIALPQGGLPRMRRLGGASLRAGSYFSEFFAAECEAAWMENAAVLAVQGLWHWQGGDLYGKLFGYSAFDPFFTFGARGWTGHGVGQVGPKGGVGAFWHLTEEISLRADADATFCLDSAAGVAYTLSVGIQYSF